MKRQDFLDTRSPEYLEAVEAIQEGVTPLLFSTTRASQHGVANRYKPFTSWEDVTKVIRWLVNNRADRNHANCFHCTPTVNRKQWNKYMRQFYKDRIEGLDI